MPPAEDDKSYKIKVLRVVSRLNIGGPSIHCSILLDGFNNSRFTSKLVTGKVLPNEGDMSYRVNDKNGLLMRIPEMQREISLTQDMKAFYKLFRIIHKENPDIVHTHMAKAGALSRSAVWIHNLLFRKKIRTVHTYHGHVLEGYFNPIKSTLFIFIEKILAKTTDAIVAISQTQKWEFSKKYKICSAEKIHVINLGFDLSCFLNQVKTGKLRNETGVDEHTLLIGIVGRLVPIKNHKLFLDAAKLIKEKLSNRSVRFIIVGDGELRQQIEQYAEKINMRKDVLFYGWARDIQNIYSDLDIVLLTSDNEGTPVSIIEAMASSVPVVTTGVGGVKDLLGRIENRKNCNGGYCICERGIMCPKDNPEAIANGVVHLMGNDKNGMVERARAFVLQNYTDKRLVERMENLYNTLL
jgi:glycosyltransferase involved in cell wall biosynthesis